MARTPGSSNDPGDAERLLLAMADHLHEHCECGGAPPRCPACDLRGQLRGIREALLAWRAEGRRLAARRDEAIANGVEHVLRDGDTCQECAALAALARAVGSGGSSGGGDYSVPTSSS
ncbi:MAG: hypothetical protein JWM90_2094 [Thermoleophilia bacterium]|nr:hypothetical protein [Thermoleophilia bacterium]